MISLDEFQFVLPGSPVSPDLRAQFNRMKVTLATVASPIALRCGRGVVGPDGMWRENEIGEVFVLIPAMAAGGFCLDWAAWNMRTREIATLRGFGAVLGEDRIGIDGAGTMGAPIKVHRWPGSWLRAGRSGIVLVDDDRAARLLAGHAVLAEDHRHGEELVERLALCPVRVLVRS